MGVISISLTKLLYPLHFKTNIYRTTDNISNWYQASDTVSELENHVDQLKRALKDA